MSQAATVSCVTDRAIEGDVTDLVRHRKMFPSRLRRFCTQELKLRPMARWFKKQDEEMINAIGIRGAESKARAKLPSWEYSKEFDAEVWRPLMQWSEQDVIDTHHRHGLAPNPLYLKGAERVGCWPCIFSRKREIAMVAELTPERIDVIRMLEQDLGDRADELNATLKPRAAESLREFWQCRHQIPWTDRRRWQAHAEARGHLRELRKTRNRPTFFHPKGHDPERNDFVPIDDVVAWSRTSHGGRQLLMFDREPPGCVRWGMCEGHGG